MLSFLGINNTMDIFLNHISKEVNNRGSKNEG